MAQRKDPGQWIMPGFVGVIVLIATLLEIIAL
jgi:hypothetical protein